MDYRRPKTDIQPLLIGEDPIERVLDVCFLGMQITSNLTWRRNATTIVNYCAVETPFIEGTSE